MMTFPVSGMILQLTMINRIKKDLSLSVTPDFFPMTFLGSCVISKLHGRHHQYFNRSYTDTETTTMLAYVTVVCY